MAQDMKPDAQAQQHQQLRGGFFQDVVTNVVSDPISLGLGYSVKVVVDQLKDGGGKHRGD